MAVLLQGSPTLQGGATTLQGSSGASLQGSVSPQPAYGPIPAARPPQPAPAPAPAPKPVTKIAPVKAVTTTPQPVAQPKPLNSIFDPYIGTRPSPTNPGVLEYYNKQTGQGFSDQYQLFNFASQLGAGAISSFDQLHAPVQGASAGAQGVQLTDPNQNVATDAGTAGLSLDEFMKLIQGQNQLTPEEIAKIRDGLGIDNLEQTVFTPPSQTTEQLYSDAYNSAGLADVKSKILALNDQINQRNQQFIDAQGTINENPFLSEASRVGRISRLQDKAQQEISNLVGQQKQYQDLYQQGLNEINGLVTRHTNDFTQEQTLNAQKLQYLLSKAEQQAAAKLSEKNQASYSYLPAYLQAKAKATPGATFSAGNGASFVWDKASGTFQQISGPTSGYTSVTDLSGNPVPFNQGTGTYGSISIPQNTLAFRNNNPGNLRYVGQAGATQGEGGFAKFSTPEAGYQAYLDQVRLDASRGLTLSQFINKYAPPSENNTAQYIQQATQALGVNANTPLSQIDINKLAAFQLQKESGTTFTSGQAQMGGDASILTPFIRRTATGAQYIDIDKVGSKQKDAVQLYAGQAGIPILSSQESGKLNNIEVSRSNLQNIESKVTDFLPSGPADRAIQGPLNKLADYFQTNPDIAAFKSYRTAIINNVQALAGGEGSGLRINQAEIDTALKNDLPEITDTIQVAQTKLDNLRSQLSLWETQLLRASGPNAGSSGLPMPGGYPASGGSADLSDLNFKF